VYRVSSSDSFERSLPREIRDDDGRPARRETFAADEKVASDVESSHEIILARGRFLETKIEPFVVFRLRQRSDASIAMMS